MFLALLSKPFGLAGAFRAPHLWIIYDRCDCQVRVRVQQLLNVGQDVSLGIHQHIVSLEKRRVDTHTDARN